jgi:hypothetical protein
MVLRRNSEGKRIGEQKDWTRQKTKDKSIKTKVSAE